MDHPILQIVMRYLHVASAILLVGGVSFRIYCVTPSLRLLEDGLRGSVQQLIQKRFDKLALLSVLGLLVSGIYNWIMLAGTYQRMGPKGNALIGTKALLAVIIFGLLWARWAGVIKSDKIAKTNLHLAAVVILLAVLLRYFRLQLG